MADKFEDLRTYVTVVTCGRVNAAASALGIVKSAFNRRLLDLEARLGMSLIERARRGFEVIVLGRDHSRQATDILARLEETDAVVAAPAAGAIVAIAASPPLLINLVAPALATICARADTAPRRLRSRRACPIRRPRSRASASSNRPTSSLRRPLATAG